VEPEPVVEQPAVVEPVPEDLPGYDPVENIVVAFLDIPETLKVGEILVGGYGVNISGPEFDARLDLVYGIPGEEPCTEWTFIQVGYNDMQARAVGAGCAAEAFTKEGVYNYELEIYDCADIRQVLNDTECNSQTEAVRGNIQPIVKSSQVIRVESVQPPQVERQADVIFDIENRTLSTNDTFIGKATVRSLSPRFNARLIEKRWEDGNTAEMYESNERVFLGQDERIPGIEEIELTLRAFGDDNVSYTFDLDRFPKRGTYHYSFKVYDCDAIQAELDPPSYCGDYDEPVEDLLEPLASGEAVITVN
jgi:hypothetical protein